MSLRSFFTKERSRERTMCVACGAGLAIYAAWQFWRGSWGVGFFLGGLGLLLLAAGAWLSERHLNALATASIVASIAAAVAQLVAGIK